MNATPILLVPGLNATARVFAGQIETLWRHGPVTIANHTRGGSVAEIAASILADAPPRFALVGFSMGGYVALEMMRQARERVLRLALLDSSARPDTPEQSEKRRAQVELARGGKLELVSSQQFPNVVHPSHAADGALKAVHLGMARELGPEVFARHQQAIIGRPDSRGDLAGIAVQTLVLVGESDGVTPPDAAKELASGISGARLVVVPEAGHLALLEQPEAVNAALDGWLRE